MKRLEALRMSNNVGAASVSEEAKKTLEARKQRAAELNDFLSKNGLRMREYMKKNGADFKVSFQFLSENEELVKISKEKNGGITPKDVPTAVFVIDRDVKTGKGENPKIYLSLDFVLENDLTNEEVVWILLHELTHYKDFNKESVSYTEIFIYLEKLAGEFVEKFATEYGAVSGNKPVTPGQKSGLTSLVGKLLKGVYLNIFEDISVNHHTRLDPKIAKNKKLIPQMYRKLFNNDLLTAHFESAQFAYFLLLQEFKYPEKDRNVRITEEVQKELSDDFVIPDGRVVTAQELIDLCLNPFTSRSKSLLGHKARHEVLKVTFLESFLRLLKRDLWNILDGGEAAMEQAQSAADGAADGSPDILNPDDLRKVFEEIAKETGEGKEGESGKEESKDEDGEEGASAGDKQDKSEAENKAKSGRPKRKTQEEINNENKRKWDEEVRKMEERNGITPKIKQEKEEAESAVSDKYRELANVFKQIKFRRSELLKAVYTRPHTEGKISIPNIIRELPSFLSGRKKQDFLFFNDREFIVDQVMCPEKIQIQLVLDLSGSQFNGSNKLAMMKQMYMMLKLAVFTYNKHVEDEVKSTIDEENIKLVADIGTIVYGSGAEVAEPLGRGIGQNDYTTFEVFKKMSQNMGGTNDTAALDLVEKTTSPSDYDDMKGGLSAKLLKIMIFVTDGTGNASDKVLKARIEKMKRDGFQVLALHIGGEAADIFRSKWNCNPGPERTAEVLDRVDDLPNVVLRFVEGVLNKVV